MAELDQSRIEDGFGGPSLLPPPPLVSDCTLRIIRRSSEVDASCFGTTRSYEKGTPRKALARAGRCGESDDPIPSPTTMTASQASRRPYVPPSPAGNRVVIYEAPPQAPPPLVA
nr:PREDICTED: uncharacterized protein LOC108952584 [Musa acuminata subsp. malaccensis]